jgi:ubiquinone/menaquinone biosynthesis C-methylase UbiE
MKKITAKDFYKRMGAKGVALRKTPLQTKLEFDYLKKILNKKQKILDLACGYGRFTIPLAKIGYNVEGLDISPNLLQKARECALKEKLNIKFTLGDMLNLPYKNNSFDSVICMWSAFIELPRINQQIKALNEMLRVLKTNGFAFIEIPVPQRLFRSLNTKRKDVKPQKLMGRVVQSIVDGVLANPMYMHNLTTMNGLMKKVKPRKYKISVENFGGRPRTLIWMWK